jgi:hypothetical protein
MASVLEAILESVKMPPPSSAKASRSKTEDVSKMITTSTFAHADAGPLEAVPENLTEESLPEKPPAPAPEASSQDDLNYIVRHDSGKQLSEEQITEVEHYAKDLKYHEDPWYMVEMTKMTSFTVYQTVKRYMSVTPDFKEQS